MQIISKLLCTNTRVQSPTMTLYLTFYTLLMVRLPGSSYTAWGTWLISCNEEKERVDDGSRGWVQNSKFKYIIGKEGNLLICFNMFKFHITIFCLMFIVFLLPHYIYPSSIYAGQNNTMDRWVDFNHSSTTSSGQYNIHKQENLG